MRALPFILLALGCPSPPDEGCPKDPCDTDETTDTGPHAELVSFECGTHGDASLTELPEQVALRSTQQSFNQDWQAALLDGAIWVKPADGSEGWVLLGSTGLPDGTRLDNWGAPSEIVEISVDGVHLHALSSDGHYYRGSDMTTDIHDDFEWTDAWGGLTASGPGLSQEFSTRCGWDVADSHPFGVDHYEDANGSEHSVGAGVAHQYRLSEDGRAIHFNDWFLPEDWSRQICGPERGTFQALDISASASTMFLVGAGSELYTRLYDFDTGGENPLYTYSYIVGADGSTTRRLPDQGWLRHADITEGRILPHVSIHQDGQGNAARVLRVEGELAGAGGYFEKRIDEVTWGFVETGALLSGPFLNEAQPVEPVDAEAWPMAGTLAYESHSLEIELPDLHMVCSPTQARLLWEGEAITVGGEPLIFEFHHVRTWVDETRPVAFWEQGTPIEVQAALLVPDTLGSIDDASARAAVEEVLRDKQVVNFLGTIAPEGGSLSEIMWTEPFRVPAEEKEFWAPITLALGPGS
jgi:hypothetical protein